MSVQDLLCRLDVLLAERGLSDRKACLQAREINPAVGVDFIRDMRRRGHPPRADKLNALAQALHVSPLELSSLVDGSASKKTNSLQPIHTTQIEVRGDVQAGVWRDAMEWPRADWYAITVPLDAAYAGLHRYGLLVKGDSMNKVFPDGSVVVVINLSDLGRMPHTGEIVVAVQRSKTTSDFEATVKAVQVRDNGEMILWPQSTNPDFTVPVRVPVAGNEHDAGMPDVFIQALVVASYRPNPTVSFG